MRYLLPLMLFLASCSVQQQTHDPHKLQFHSGYVRLRQIIDEINKCEIGLIKSISEKHHIGKPIAGYVTGEVRESYLRSDFGKTLKHGFSSKNATLCYKALYKSFPIKLSMAYIVADEEVAEFGINDKCGLLVNSSRSIIFANDTEAFARIAREKAMELRYNMESVLMKKNII